MGISYVATLGYGVRIENKALDDKLGMCELNVKTPFGCMWAGSSYDDEDSQYTFVCIKKSIIRMHHYDEQKTPIKPEKLVAQSDWDKMLLAWCQEHGQNNPKIGWWLGCSEC
jgi:hypothetical protein